MHGGIKVYRGAAAAARNYLEAGRARADDYYLAEGTGLATRLVATPEAVRSEGLMDGDVYERWVGGHDFETGSAKGRLRTDPQAVRFVEVVVNGPKTWSLAAVAHPELAAAYEAAQDRAAQEIVGWLAQHATTRVGPRGRQEQVPVEQIEAAVVRHYTSRAGDPHFHLHLQVNARVYAAGRWRGLFTVGVRDTLQALNGIGHAAVAADLTFRAALANHGYSLDLDTGEIAELTPYVAAFSARAAQIGRHVDRYEAQWRAEHPGSEPGPRLRRSWDRRAWADARPDKVAPRDGAEMTRRWVEELTERGFRPPSRPVPLYGAAIGAINRDGVVNEVLMRLGARASAWNAADVRGQVEQVLVWLGVVALPAVRRELAEDLVARAVDACQPLLPGPGVPEHIRSLTSTRVVAVEHDLTMRMAARADQGHWPAPERTLALVDTRALDPAQRDVVAAVAGIGELLVIEGAAGAGKTTTLATARDLVELHGRRLIVVTPTRKAADIAHHQIGAHASSAAWLIHQHGFRWDADGRWTRLSREERQARPPVVEACPNPGDVLLVDEAGMLDQDTALALLTVADERGARVVLVGDRHQLPAVGRGGALDLAVRYAPPHACLHLDTVHRFADPDYADLSLRMRAAGTPEELAAVFDVLLARGQIRVHASDVECLAAVADQVATQPALVIADTREQVARLNGLLREQRVTRGELDGPAILTHRGEPIAVGDRVTTRRNDILLGVANRDTWTVTGRDPDGLLIVQGSGGRRTLPAEYVARHVELAYATTVHGAQGETVDRAHMVMGETTGAASAYVGMTRGRSSNVAHLVADSRSHARQQWVDIFSRDRADLGPAHAARRAAADVDRFGTMAPHRTESARRSTASGGHARTSGAVVPARAGGAGPVTLTATGENRADASRRLRLEHTADGDASPQSAWRVNSARTSAGTPFTTSARSVVDS